MSFINQINFDLIEEEKDMKDLVKQLTKKNVLILNHQMVIGI